MAVEIITKNQKYLHSKKSHLERTPGLVEIRSFQRGRTGRRKMVAVSLVSSLLLTSACQTGSQFVQNLGITQVSNNDACGVHSTALRDAKGYFEKSMIQGAVIGAIGGALLGALLGGDEKGALIGAAAGGLSGATLGYYEAKKQENADRASLVQTVYKDAQQETAESARALASFSKARECRLREAESIKAQYSGNEITREQAEQKLATERQRFAEDVTVVRAIGAKIDERHKDLYAATQDLADDSPDASRLLKNVKAAADRAWADPDLTADHSESTEQAPTMVKSRSNVNVRSAPSIDSTRIGLLEAGVNVEQLESNQEGWTKVRLGSGKQGFVATRFLDGEGHKAVMASASPAVTEPTLASLTTDVPSNADTEVRTVGVLFEGVEKRIELERLANQAEGEEKTAFTLSS